MVWCRVFVPIGAGLTGASAERSHLPNHLAGADHGEERSGAEPLGIVVVDLVVETGVAGRVEGVDSALSLSSAKPPYGLPTGEDPAELLV